MSHVIRAVAAGLCLYGLGCTASYPSGPTEPVPVALFIWQGAFGPTPIGRNARTYRAYALDSDGAYELVTATAAWQSSDGRVARPTGQAGVFEPAAEGVSQITARYRGLEASTRMIVFDPELLPSRRLIVSTNSFGAALGDVTSVSATLQGDSRRQSVSDSITVTSSDRNVVAAEGRTLRAVGVGTAVITVTFEELSEWFWLSVAPR